MSQFKKRYKSVRKQFRIDLHEAMKSNFALSTVVIQTYRASCHMDHIRKIWLLMLNHPSFRKEYGDKLFGKHLSGEDELFHSLRFAAPDIWEKYFRKIPERLAMGDALSAAYRIHKK